MASRGLNWRLVMVFGITWLIGATEARGQSQTDTQKRSFARLLARRDRDSAADARRSTDARTSSGARRSTAAATRAVGRDAGASRQPLPVSGARGAARSTLPSLAVRRRASSSNADGLSPVTPVNPSGYGFGRDAFVEFMYFETFGIGPSQRELDRLTKLLAGGMSPNTLATALWRSPEHLAILRSQHGTGLTYAEAYRYAMGAGWTARSAHQSASRGR
jgi:hypothetical protein